jgi:hypothetical protein
MHSNIKEVTFLHPRVVRRRIYDQSVKRWQAATFRINEEDKFFLKLQFIAKDTDNVDHYRVAITNYGSGNPRSRFTDNLLSDVIIDGQ